MTLPLHGAFLDLRGFSQDRRWQAIRVRLPSKKPVHEVAPSSDEAAIEMHCVPQDKVLEIVRSRGGKVVDVHEYGASGPGYVSYRYWVTK